MDGVFASKEPFSNNEYLILGATFLGTHAWYFASANSNRVNIYLRRGYPITADVQVKMLR